MEKIIYFYLDNNSLVNDDVQDGSLSGSPPPPYGDAPPPYSGSYNPAVQPPPAGVMGEPTVVCRVCQQLVFIRGREGQRVVKCSNCHEATVCILIHLFIYYIIL